MSHTNDCPPRDEAYGQGRRAFERGQSSLRNPYFNLLPNQDEPCREAQDEWDRGYRAARRRAEEDEERGEQER